MTNRFAMPAAITAAAALGILAACAAEAPTTPDAAAAAVSFARGGASDRMFYQAQLEPLGESRARGMALVEITGGALRVRVHAIGVEPGETIPQHIHVNPGCEVGGGVLVNLDRNLTVPPESPSTGPEFPEASAAGIVHYEASRPLGELRAAVNAALGLTLATDEALVEWLDLENRNVHMHVAFGPPFPAVNCGALDRVN